MRHYHTQCLPTEIYCANMLNSIVRFSIQKKLFVALTTLFLFLGGLYAMFTLPIDAVPDYNVMLLELYTEN